ncbi:DUF397 domain-containing protein [Actinoplanes awajinensis]|uniref:DUF397 domain-containing protein n=1 Tax=Actinoplanes awajinensis subsp. mycoplanecinus TaxID=135947 RepID=A0A101J7Q8_9ACTN|nr:DUF397 domain-containing protein [Actinoplanes awajinensis]KUL21773.1 hypothetical protein ADL15_49920 [Actinoplanes awajinensis subsp. mycoplanecinus]
MFAHSDTQADLPWRTSSFCSNTSCVEVAVTPDFVAVRDSKNLQLQALTYTTEEWRQFIAGAKNGEFDVA